MANFDLIKYLAEGKLLKENKLNEIKLFADFKAESNDDSMEVKFARSMSETLHLLDYIYGKTNVENLTINDLFTEGDMNSIQDGDEFYAGPGESLRFFQTLPEEFIIINNIDGDKESFKITKTGKNSFNAEKN